MGKVAMRIQVDTCARSEKRPDCERARMPVPKAIDDEMMCAVVLECVGACLLLMSWRGVFDRAELVQDVVFE